MDKDLVLRLDFRKKRGDLLTKHKAELTGMLYAYAKADLTIEEQQDFKQRVEELIERQKGEMDAFYVDAAFQARAAGT